MSNPANSLAAFRSYSYYHVLVMCDSTATADKLAEDSSLDIWNHATQYTRVQGLDDLGPYSPKCVGGSGKYIVLINGSTDAAYVITNAKWTTATAANAAPGDKATSIAIEGSLSISEPKGIAFLDQIVQCSITLGVDSSQVVYVLKTFFVGHLDGITDDEYNAPEPHITDIPPLNCVVYDVTGSFTEAGGTYEMNFVSVGHGAARLPQYSSVSGLNITAGKTLKETFTKLQDSVNESYDRYYDCVTGQIAEVKGADPADLLGSLRKVKYVIEVSKDYDDPKYAVTDQKQQQKTIPGCDSPAQLQFPVATSIETAIGIIMNMCPQVKDDMAIGDTTDKAKYEYKIHTALKSTPMGGVGGAGCSDSQLFDYTVYYRVERFLTPKSIAYNSAFETLQQDDDKLRSDPNYNLIRRNIIEFDYMYTGKNIDILEFDMKLNYGLAYLQTATLANTFKSQIERQPTNQTIVSDQDANTSVVRLGGSSVQTPVFFGTQIKSPSLISSSKASSSVQSAYTLTKHASIEVAEATMRITGNDQLLRRTNKTSSSKFVTETSALTSPKDSVNTPDENCFDDWSRVPAFAKVKIKMPRNNDDFSLFTGQSGGKGDESLDYARDFWFDGYYYIYGVDHEFNQGEFSQTLHMIALPKKSAFDSAGAIKSTEVSINANIGNCYDSKVPCGSTGSSSPGSGGGSNSSGAGAGRGSVHPPFVRPDTTGEPTNLPDAQTANNQSGRKLSDVPGWDKADPQVKQSIVNAANRYGVDPVTLAQIAAKESGFNPNAKAKTSSATGLFQFIDSTWVGQVNKDAGIGVNRSGQRSDIMNARYDPQASANAGASYVADNIRTIGSSDPGDIYLAHFAGPGTAKRVIAADKSGNGNTPLREIVGDKTFAKMRAANATIITRENYTAGELRAWSAKKMSSKVTNSPSPKTPPPQGPSAPVSPNTPEKRTVRDVVGAAQDCETQERKKDLPACGDTSERKGK